MELKFTHIWWRYNGAYVILTKRLELLFLTVLAFPKASKSGFDSKITSFIFYNVNVIMKQYK